MPFPTAAGAGTAALAKPPKSERRGSSAAPAPARESAAALAPAAPAAGGVGGGRHRGGTPVELNGTATQLDQPLDGELMDPVLGACRRPAGLSPHLQLGLREVEALLNRFSEGHAKLSSSLAAWHAVVREAIETSRPSPRASRTVLCRSSTPEDVAKARCASDHSVEEELPPQPTVTHGASTGSNRKRQTVTFADDLFAQDADFVSAAPAPAGGEADDGDGLDADAAGGTCKPPCSSRKLPEECPAAAAGSPKCREYEDGFGTFPYDDEHPRLRSPNLTGSDFSTGSFDATCTTPSEIWRHRFSRNSSQRSSVHNTWGSGGGDDEDGPVMRSTRSEMPISPSRRNSFQDRPRRGSADVVCRRSSGREYARMISHTSSGGKVAKFPKRFWGNSIEIDDEEDEDELDAEASVHSAPNKKRATDLIVAVTPSMIAQVSSESELSELEEEPPAANLRRRGGVSAEATGDFNKNYSGWVPQRHAQTPKEREGIMTALRAFPFLSNQDEETLSAICGCTPISEFQPGMDIVVQGEYGKCGYILISGRADVYIDGKFIRQMKPGRFFGEHTMLFGFRRGASARAVDVCVVARLAREDFFQLATRQEMAKRSMREGFLRNMRMFETLDDEQIAKVADAMRRRAYSKSDRVISQGDLGSELFVVISGELKAVILTGHDDSQTHRFYKAGDRFGELAFIHRAKRAATIIVTSERAEVLSLKRRSFERMLGSLEKLQQEQYMHDPRKLIADFYLPGDKRGPRGVCPPPGCDEEAAEDEFGETFGETTEWFSVYRPTSRDAIAKMLSGAAVGKGLNVKGKSSKKNHLSGFVPFLQISDDAHKIQIEESPPEARVSVFYQTEAARNDALLKLEHLTRPEAGLGLQGDPSITLIDKSPDLYGACMHERVLREAYIMQPPLAFLVGWETGRASVPAFMDMNLHAVRDERSEPRVVLYQFDQENAMNPHGLLMAYDEGHVKPVVSDFDTFTVGSRGMDYDPLPPSQQELARQVLDRTAGVLEHRSANSWNSEWLTVLKEQGMPAVSMPKFGFGDATSTRLIEAVVRATCDSGAVRHGAECFNFLFPQELDEEYLVVWQHFDDKPWRFVDQVGLRDFLMERATEGFSFPLNPVWPVRDRGWYELYEALRGHSEGSRCFDAWYPPESGIVQRIEEIRARFPEGFSSEGLRPSLARGSTGFIGDLDCIERADFAAFKARKSGKWRRVRNKMSILLIGRNRSSVASGDSGVGSPERAAGGAARAAEASAKEAAAECARALRQESDDGGGASS